MNQRNVEKHACGAWLAVGLIGFTSLAAGDPPACTQTYPTTRSCVSGSVTPRNDSLNLADLQCPASNVGAPAGMTATWKCTGNFTARLCDTSYVGDVASCDPVEDAYECKLYSIYQTASICSSVAAVSPRYWWGYIYSGTRDADFCMTVDVVLCSTD